MQLYCRNCGEEIPAQNINVQETIAVCKACNAVFDFSATVAQEKRKRKMVSMPDRFHMDERPDELELAYHWFTPMAILMTVFTVIWSGPVLLIFMPLFLGGTFNFASLGGGIFSIFSFFPLIFGGVAVGLIYYTVGLWINQTVITVSDSEIKVRSKPLPTLGNKTIDSRFIGQLYVKQRVSRNSNSGGTSITYQVRIVTDDGKNQTLVGNLPKSEQALYIEQQIERYLRLKNEPIPGEYGRY